MWVLDKLGNWPALADRLKSAHMFAHTQIHTRMQVEMRVLDKLGRRPGLADCLTAHARSHAYTRTRVHFHAQVEMRMLDKLGERPDLADRLKAVAKQLNLVEEEAYDLVLMRNEYKTLMGLHTGRVPAELKEIFEELQEQ